MAQNPIIEAQRAKVAAQRAELRISEAVLHGMELVDASYAAAPAVVAPKRSAAPKTAPADDSPKVGGKPKGSISQNWRKVLSSFYATDARFSDSDIKARELQLNGRILRGRAVRRLFEGYAELGFIEIGEDGLYCVTDTAAERFGFDRAPLGEREANEAEIISDGETSASSLFSRQEGGGDHAANVT
jgi:hypothetical protein